MSGACLVCALKKKMLGGGLIRGNGHKCPTRSVKLIGKNRAVFFLLKKKKARPILSHRFLTVFSICMSRFPHPPPLPAPIGQLAGIVQKRGATGTHCQSSNIPHDHVLASRFSCRPVVSQTVSTVNKHHYAAPSRSG